MKIKLLIFAACIVGALNASQLKSDEYVMFIPNIAYDSSNGTIEAEVRAYVYEKEMRLGVTTALVSLLDIDMDNLSAVEKQRVYARSALFRIDFEGDKDFSVKFEDESLAKMPKTIDGKSSATVKLKKTDKPKHEITFEVYKSKYPKNTQKGSVFYAADEGVSAVFDIDDTVKDSNVLDKKALLINTFVNEYKKVGNIQDIFDLTKNMHADSYHYVSASPVQLYPALKSFFEKEGFPRGSFHLRDTTDLSDFIADKETTISHKKTNIEKLFKSYPKRKFILVGDSGENDPEIYADLTRKYPDKVLRIIIRDLTKDNEARFKETFKGIDKNKISFF
ncbi:MAG: App1 family protein [Campylobacteraceae bacterium]|nr:App1 family protein [Campylobacteraceae bacterium]